MSVHISYSEIESAASALGAGREEITAKLQHMSGQIAGLVSSGFVTEQASGRFHEAYERYTQSVTGVISELTEIEAFLRETARSVQELDHNIAARVQI